MAIIKEKSETMQDSMPKLFIGKIFKRELMTKGKRVPHFLTDVEVNSAIETIEGQLDGTEGRRASVQLALHNNNEPKP